MRYTIDSIRFSEFPVVSMSGVEGFISSSPEVTFTIHSTNSRILTHGEYRPDAEVLKKIEELNELMISKIKASLTE